MNVLSYRSENKNKVPLEIVQWERGKKGDKEGRAGSPFFGIILRYYRLINLMIASARC